METKIVTANKPIDFTVEYSVDNYMETDWMGHFSSDWSPGAIDIAKSGMFYRLPYTHFKYWIPTPGGSDYVEYENEYKNNRGHMSKHAAGIAGHQHARQDFRRIVGLENQQWYFVVITVTAPWGESRSMAGLESDYPDYIAEVEQDLIDELLEQTTITVTIG